MAKNIINRVRTGRNINRIRLEHGLSIGDIQTALNLETRCGIYKWFNGETLPSLDNFILLARLFDTTIEDIIIPNKADA